MSVFSNEVREKIEHYTRRYETKLSGLLPILHVIQDHYGWISPAYIKALCDEFGYSKVQIYEVATFYSMYRLKEPKPLRILFCNNVVCSMMGGDEVMEEIKGIIETAEKQGKPSPFSLEGVPCLGVCDGAPAMLVNKDRFLKVTKASARDVMNRYAGGQQ